MIDRRLSVLLLIQQVSACLPGPFGLGGFNPAFSGGYYGGVPPVMGPRIGPFRSEQQAHAPTMAAAKFQTQLDEVQSVSSLNCAHFMPSGNCRWGNTNEEELDWSTLAQNPIAERWLHSLGVHTAPDPGAAVLVSSARQGWEGGRLVSDYLPCVGPALRLTATVWSSRDGIPTDQPQLQVCTRNQGEESLPLVNCNSFNIRNGVPMTVEIPQATELNTPAQIVLNGYNFMSAQGGAIFIQDIVVEGSLACSSSSFDNHPILIDDQQPTLLDGILSGSSRGRADSVGPLRALEGLGELEAIDADVSSQFESNQALSSLQKVLDAKSLTPPAPSSQQLGPIGFTPTLFETCLALSCNPSDLSCKFWRSAGNNRWEIGSAKRVSNPLTGIHLPPGTSQKFLVAPFLDSHITSYTLVSESLSIPALSDVYFCFYEYYATQGLELSVCTDTMNCFYRRSSLTMGDAMEANKRWNIKCAKLPVGNYEMRVIAENHGGNKGEVGFLPIRLSRDPEGLDFIC